MATKTATPTPKQGTDVGELLEENQVSDYINKNKGTLLGAVAVIVLGIVIYGYLKDQGIQKSNKYSDELYTYTAKSLKDFKEGKLAAGKLVSGFETVYKGKEGFASAGVFIAQMADELVAKENRAEAYALLKVGIDTLNNGQILFFLNTRAAAVAEDMGKNQEALTHLENILKGSTLYMADKVYLDAGRLYLRLGNKEKAKSSFQWVVDQGKEEEFKKMAKLYLDELGA